MNKIIKRDFRQVKEGEKRKRWYCTMECQCCSKVFEVLERPRDGHRKPCETCARRIPAYRAFLERAVKKHGNKFDYSLITVESYVDIFTPVQIVCEIHGTFTQKPKDHTYKTGGKLCCPECVQDFNRLHNKRSIESWKEELETRFPHITMVEHGNSDSNQEPCTLLCEHHGEFNSKLASIKQDIHLCHTCAQDANSWGNRTRRVDVPGTVYFIHIPSIGHYKLGATKTGVTERFRQLPHDYTVVWEQEFDTLKEAYDSESRLFRVYKDFRPYTAYRKPSTFELFGGYTELLSCEIPFTALQQSDLLSKNP